MTQDFISPPPALQIVDLHLTYPKTRTESARMALRGITLDVPTGQAIALLGPNGSGKSTLLKIIAGALPADRGTVCVFGKCEWREIRQQIGVVFQRCGLDPQMTVQENLRDLAVLYGLPTQDAQMRLTASLQAAGLEDRANSQVKTLSGGLKRRVDLCRAMLHDPGMLLLDEPTAGLDPTARTEFLDLLDALREQNGLTVLTSTHLIDESERCDRVLMMHEGRIVADDEPKALRRKLGGHQLTVHDPCWTPQETEAMNWRRGSQGWICSGTSERISDLSSHINELSKLKVSFTFAPPTLADVFEQVTGAVLMNGTSDVPADQK